MEGIERDEEVVPIVPSAPPFISDDFEDGDGNRDESSRATDVQGETIADSRLDGLLELCVDDGLGDPSPVPVQVEPFARTNEPRSRPASNPIKVTVGSKRRVDRSITAPFIWIRGAMVDTSGIVGRVAAKAS